MDAIRFLIVLLPLLGVLAGCFSSCVNTVASAMQNPKGPQFAVVFTRDCGATTTWSTNVLIASDSTVANDATANVFVADGGTPQQPGVTVAWDSVRTLAVSYSSRLRVFKKVDRVGDVSIIYAETP